MSKKEKKIITVLLIIGVIIVGVALILLPSEIPFHLMLRERLNGLQVNIFF